MEERAAVMENEVQNSVMTKDVFNKTFWRSFPLQGCFCYERMQNVGFAYQMLPALKELYPDGEEAKAAMKRHLAIFNTTPAIVTFITGAAIAMEEKFKKAKDVGEECDEESINAVKTALMGPLAGIGDAFFWGTLRIIGAGIGCSIAAQGSILGAILFLLIYNIPHFLVRYKGLELGYKSGISFLESMTEGGAIAVLTPDFYAVFTNGEIYNWTFFCLYSMVLALLTGGVTMGHGICRMTLVSEKGKRASAGQIVRRYLFLWLFTELPLIIANLIAAGRFEFVNSFVIIGLLALSRVYFVAYFIFEVFRKEAIPMPHDRLSGTTYRSLS